MTAATESQLHRADGQPKLLTSGQLATALGVSAGVVRRLADAGEIPVVRLGRRYLFRAGDVEPVISIVRGDA